MECPLPEEMLRHYAGATERISLSCEHCSRDCIHNVVDDGEDTYSITRGGRCQPK